MVRSRSDHRSVRSQISQITDHGQIIVRSQSDHGQFTVKSRSDHRSARSRSDHSQITVRSQSNHDKITVTSRSDHLSSQSSHGPGKYSFPSFKHICSYLCLNVTEVSNNIRYSAKLGLTRR